MTGALFVQTAAGQGAVKLVPSNSTTNCGYVEWTNPDGTRKAFLGYRDPTTLELELASATALQVKNGELQLHGSGTVNSSWIRAQSGAGFAFSNTNNANWETALHLGHVQIQYKSSGNADGVMRVWTANGGYTDNWVFETTISNIGPGINVNGAMKAKIVKCPEGHKIEFNDADNYICSTNTNRILFRSNDRLTFHISGVEKFFIDANGYHGTAAAFADSFQTNDGFDLVAELKNALAEIKTLKSEVAALRKVK
jgi:hypothetical protein